MSQTCKHERVYSSGLKTSSPPIATWICRKCLHKEEHHLWRFGAPRGEANLQMELFEKRAEKDADEFRRLNTK